MITIDNRLYDFYGVQYFDQFIHSECSEDLTLPSIWSSQGQKSLKESYVCRNLQKTKPGFEKMLVT